VVTMGVASGFTPYTISTAASGAVSVYAADIGE
jgi:hypothetical protein